MKPIRLAGLATLIALAACRHDPNEPLRIEALPRELTSSEQGLIRASNDFAFALLRETLSRHAPTDNVFISPVSVSMALGMALNGAAGQTWDSMRVALRLAGLSETEINASYRSLIDLLRGLDPNVAFEIANSVWYRLGYQPLQPFLDVTRQSFDAEVTGLDFSSANAAGIINSWVNARTRGRITEIVSAPIPDDIIAYLVNAIYFKGAWTTRFDPARTVSGSFRLVGGGTVTAQMMNGPQMPLWLHSEPGTLIGELSYGGGAWRATIVVPQEPSALDSLARNLNSTQWDSWVAELDSTAMAVVMPRLELSYSLDSLNSALKSLGMRNAFCDEPPGPDFSRFFPNACISDVRHRTFVLVNEEGTEAAAVTSVGVGLTSVPPSFTVDRPFLFIIRERFSGTILFIGRIANPAVN
ncbi:MAG TPA: serpin family protein [Gemmatimonadales bacterium]|nr:serpin family protein [Gemmatimonadales bacterium]